MRKQGNPFAVRMVVLPSGERLPMLLCQATGLPLFAPTVWSLTELRARNRSTATIQQALRGVMVLCLVLDRLGVDLDARLREGRLLEVGEVDDIARHCGAWTEDLVVGPEEMYDPSPLRRKRVARLERARTAPSQRVTAASVDPNTAAIRMRYIRDYLKWRTTVSLLEMGPTHELYRGLRNLADIVTGLLNVRMPISSGRHSLAQREGLAPEDVETLIRVTDPSSPENPWADAHSRERNALILRWLLSLGLRRGELLGVRISDINFQANEVLIARRPDSPDDPRKYQPNTKTRARLLPIDENLAVLTRQYIVGARRKIPGARRHEFLIVACGTGAPLTLEAVNKIFDALRRRCPSLPDELSPHVCRHTWNDRFSAMMERQEISAEMEKKMRSRLMGWSETSQTAATYTRRHTQEKARKASLDLQGMMNGQSEDGTDEK
jgi:integrase